MPGSKHFKLKARVSSESIKAVRKPLEEFAGVGTIKEQNGELLVEADLEGASSKDLNRTLLSSLRRVEKRTRLRSEWTSEKGLTEHYFDYVLKKTTTTAKEK